jgi:hypothetical protein
VLRLGRILRAADGTFDCGAVAVSPDYVGHLITLVPAAVTHRKHGVILNEERRISLPSGRYRSSLRVLTS